MTKPLVICLGNLALTATMFSMLSGCSTMPGWVKPVGDAVVTTDETSEKSEEESVKHFESTRDKAMLSAADARWQSKDSAGCEATLLTLLTRSPGCVAAQLMLADLYAATNRLERAEDQLQLALNQNPENADVQHAMALVLEEKGDVVTAGQHFDAAVRLEPLNELFKLSQETASDTTRAIKEEASAVILTSATVPLGANSDERSNGLTLRFNDSDNPSRAKPAPVAEYPETAASGAGIEDRVEELKAILESLPTETEESVKPLSQRQPMIRLPS